MVIMHSFQRKPNSPSGPGRKARQAQALLIAIIVMAIFFSAGAGFLGFMQSLYQVNTSAMDATRAYYVAQSGLEIARYRLAEPGEFTLYNGTGATDIVLDNQKIRITVAAPVTGKRLVTVTGLVGNVQMPATKTYQQKTETVDAVWVALENTVKLISDDGQEILDVPDGSIGAKRIAVNASQNVCWVTDALTGQVRRISPDGSYQYKTYNGVRDIALFSNGAAVIYYLGDTALAKLDRVSMEQEAKTGILSGFPLSTLAVNHVYTDNVYMNSSASPYIRKWDSDLVTRSAPAWASAVTGRMVFSSSTGIVVRTSSGFQSPPAAAVDLGLAAATRGIASDSAGHVWLADPGNKRIRRVRITGTSPLTYNILSHVTGLPDSPSFVSAIPGNQETCWSAPTSGTMYKITNNWTADTYVKKPVATVCNVRDIGATRASVTTVGE